MIERHEEQRGYFRMCIDCPVVFGTEAEGYAHKGIVKNLSASGLLFYTDVSVNIGDKLRASIEPLNDITPPMILSAIVLRQTDVVGEDNTGGRYSIACSATIVQ